MQSGTRALMQWLSGARKRRMPDLGRREIELLEVLWDAGEATAQQILGRLTAAPISLSTVQSTLERLHRKQLVTRVKAGRAFCYRPLLSRAQLIGGLLRDLARDVAGGNLAPMVSGFLDYVGEEDPALHSDLSRWVNRREDSDG